MTRRFAFWNAIATLVAIALLFLFVSPSGSAPEWARFLARQHPAIVHLPIGFLLFGALLALFRRWKKESTPGPTEQAALVMGGWGAVAAAAAGSWLIQMGAFPADALQWHRALGFVVPLAAAGTLLLSLEDWPRPFQGIAWTILIGSIFLGGHLGGEMTHGEGYSGEYAPGILQSVMSEAPSLTTRFDLSTPDATTVYEGIVAPILQARCTSCHGEGRTKGGLDLSTPDAITAHETDSEDDPLITWGEPESSLLIQRVMLPAEHRRAMPPSLDARPISHADVELLKWWVASESAFEGMISDAERPDAIERLLTAYGMGDIQTGVFALDLPEPDTTVIRNVTTWGITLSRVAADLPLLEWTGSNTTPLYNLQDVNQIAPNIIAMDLSGGNAQDLQLERVADFPHLTSLDLSRTDITGSTLGELAQLQYLTRLNLYGTQVDDAALEHLAGFPALESVYLWQTNVTEEGVARLRDALPNAVINTGE